LNVLIADDNELALDALVQISHQLGWKTNAVQDGQQAIDYALAQPDAHAPDVVIVDWKMPIKDGIEVTKTIREHYKGKAAPIFVMATAFSREQLNATNGADLIDVVLSKPVTASSLYDAVSAVMKKRGKQDESSSALAIMASTRLSELAILVVDDSEINRDLAKRIFLREGAQVVTANHGEEAVSILNKSLDDPFDIVIMDVQMPIMDGLEATKRIRENPLLASLPVIALTAGAFTTQKEAALSSGMNAVMTKPFNVDKLVNLILELTKKGPVASADKASVAISEKVYLDRDNGIAIWGDEVVYQRYLNRFSDDYHFLLTEPDTIDNSDFAGTLHKLKGAASNLGLTVLADAAGKFEQTVQLGKQSKPDFSHFRVILSRTFDEIKRYTASRHSETVNQVKNSLGQLISQLEMELDSDNPDKIWPIMAELEQLNASEQLTRIREHVEKFEFRKAELCLAEMKSSLN
jgi:CheY-like chemotaxis protein